jgi:hypothetical protein
MKRLSICRSPPFSLILRTPTARALMDVGVPEGLLERGTRTIPK